MTERASFPEPKLAPEKLIIERNGYTEGGELSILNFTDNYFKRAPLPDTYGCAPSSVVLINYIMTDYYRF
jgi:hypothetical protein